jgi:hypothetical protein
LATDVEETSEAEVHEISAENGPDEGDKNATGAAAQATPVDEFQRSAAAARESLIAELQRTVESVSSAVDDATARTFEEAQAEARRQAEEASARVDALERDGLVKLRELADELVERSQWLSNQISELTSQAATTSAKISAEDGPAKLVSKAPPAPEPEREVSGLEREAEQRNEADAEHSADDEKQGAFGLFRRRRPADVS